MDLRHWRKSEGLTLAETAPLLLIPVSSLSDIEKGQARSVSHETIARIIGVTGGKVQPEDLYRAWKIRMINTSTHVQAGGRAAWRAFRSTRQPAKRKTNGKKG